MNRASHELSHWAEYDYVVTNNQLDSAYSEVEFILKAERLRRERQTGLSAFVRELQKQLEP
jgi:guanylate kinase